MSQGLSGREWEMGNDVHALEVLCCSRPRGKEGTIMTRRDFGLQAIASTCVDVYTPERTSKNFIANVIV